jgi:proline iminopeptidase
VSERIELVDTGGPVLHTVIFGSGPPIVWCHGGPGLWDYVAPLAQVCANAGWIVYRYDQRGCGASSAALPNDVAANVADLEALRVHYGHERWVVAGHSWGASLALLYALAHPERTAGVVYLSGVGSHPGWHAAFREEDRRRRGEEGVARLVALRQQWESSGSLEDERAFCVEQWSIDYADQQQARKLAARLFRDDARIARDVHRELWASAVETLADPALPQRLRELDVPALVIHGELDPRPHWSAQQLAGLLPRARFVMLEGAGHNPWVEMPDEVESVLGGFLTSFGETL